MTFESALDVIAPPRWIHLVPGLGIAPEALRVQRKPEASEPQAKLT